MRGGTRTGSGRKPGVSNKPHILDYWNKHQVNEFFEFVCDAYKEDSRLAVWVGDQISGKAQQAIDHTTKGEALPTPILPLNVLPRDNGDTEDQPLIEED